LGSAYLFYFRRVLPRLGQLVNGSKNDAYQYLPDSVMAFPEREAFLQLMRDAGLQAPRQTILSCGIAAIYRGEVQA
jgi:demethylmenaquinone methyltransferase/2-methoxy-6-polyprenyl-1,4-benzoquinol methylase